LEDVGVCIRDTYEELRRGGVEERRRGGEEELRS
jgi:hypothetical protein